MYAAIVTIDGNFYCAVEHLTAQSFQDVKIKMMGWMRENPTHLVSVNKIPQSEWEKELL
jgi:hypothetical protein